MSGYSVINGVEMANIKTIAGVDAPSAGATLLADLDFTTMTSASWRGEDTVSLSGQTWTIGNGDNSNQFGPNGSELIFHPKGTAAGDWWQNSRTGPYLSIKLSDLDSDLQAGGDAQYAVQVVCKNYPSGAASNCRFLVGYWSDDSPARGYTALFGNQYFSGQEHEYYFGGYSTEDRTTEDVNHRTFYCHLNPSGFHECFASLTKDGNNPHGGTSRGSIFCGTTNPNSLGDQPALRLTASAPVNVGIVAVGDHLANTGPVYEIERLRVWKLNPEL
tara:strand:- start:2528 stop:3349 length:822 start_codon:yes stop_codon:yes gene_type:complete